MQCHVGAHLTYRPTQPAERSGTSRAGTRRPVLAFAVPLLSQVATIAISVFLYFFVRGLVDAREDDAVRDALWLIDLEQRLGFFWEPSLQEWALGIGPVWTMATGSTSGATGR